MEANSAASAQPQSRPRATFLTSTWYKFAESIPGLEINGNPAPYPVVNERAVRAAAGLTLIAAAVAFAPALLQGNYEPIKVITTLLFYDFTVRIFTGLTPLSPFGVLGTLLVINQKPEYVGAVQKRFAWGIGVALSFTMMVFTNSDITSTYFLYICMVCLAFMWLECAVGFCVGCWMYKYFTSARDHDPEAVTPACPGGVCEIPPGPQDKTPPSSD
ncbi:MAG: DUF4395 domain-containing protein [Planctomycetota bacterium]|nr:DUF4395 domain-containing protein [Planctomycetota bacterium]